MFICLCVHKQASARTSTCSSCKIFAVLCTAFLMNRRVVNTFTKQRYSAFDSVIPGQDQGSYFNEDTNVSDKKTSYRSQPSDSWSQPGMTTWWHCMIILFYSDTRTQEHKNASYEHPSLHP